MQTTIIWAVCVLILVIFFVLLFRKTIAKKIRDIKSIDKWKLQFNHATNQDEGTLSLVDELSQHFDPQLVKDREISAFEVLGLKDINDQDEVIKKLLKYVAIQDIRIVFDSYYNSIYGSQLELLQALNSSSATLDEIKELYYDPLAEFYPTFYPKYTFKSWINFLHQRQLIIKPENSDKYTITVYGREFLTYLTKNANNFAKNY